jgi:hypothetical protein
VEVNPGGGLVPRIKAKPGKRQARKHRFMKKNRTRYVVLSCGDNKLQNGTRRTLREHGIDQPDNLKLAGGPGVLASINRPFSRMAFLEDTLFMVKHHKADVVVLLSHQCCGAYADSGFVFNCKRFTNRERDFHVADLRKARAMMKAYLAANGYKKVRIMAGVHYVDDHDKMHIHWIR